MANEIGLAGLHKAKELCLVSLGETAVALPSEREERMETERGFAEHKRARKGFGGRGDGRLIVERKTHKSQLSNLILNSFLDICSALIHPVSGDYNAL